MKTHFSKILRTSLAAALFIPALLLSSCEKDGQNKPKDPVNPKECSYTGTFKSIPCGVSIYDNFWILLDNGKYIRPCETEVMFRCPVDLKDGQRVKVGFVPSAPGNWCDQQVTCMIATPMAESVKITCLQLIDAAPKCDQFGYIVHDPRLMRPCNPLLVKLLDGTMVEPVNPQVLSNYKNGDKIDFSYVIVCTLTPTCSGAPAVEITCLNGNATNNPCVPMTTSSNVPPNDPSAVQVYDATLNGNCLEIDAGFSGCNDDISRFYLNWNGYMAKSNPPHVTVTVRNKENNQQTCGAYFRKKMNFDISALKKVSPGPINVHITGTDKLILY